jgi:protein-tyrosine phosphatase
MDAENYNDVRRISGKYWDANKVDLLLNEIYSGENRSVPDPWFGKEDGFHTVYKMIDKACQNIVKKYVPPAKDAGNF